MKINKELIEKFLESPDKELSLPMMPIDDIDSILCYELGYIHLWKNLSVSTTRWL